VPARRLVPDARLDRYRDRVATLLRDGTPRGYLLPSVEKVRTRLGGHFWWTRWSEPREFLMCEVALGDEASGYEIRDFWVDRDLDEELARWEQGRLLFGGDEYTLQWMSVEASLPVARRVFEIVGFVNGQVDELGSGAPVPLIWRTDQLQQTPTARDDIR
jgi:hypothetical protein